MKRPGAPGIRERNRLAIISLIVTEARHQLATDGAAGLSLRAVARELGMASSAIYRYFPSRDDLLTRLIIDAYEALGDAVQEAERKVPRRDLAGRFTAIGRSLRRWALEHEHEYALIYGSPVPGYRAPQDTIGPATRVSGLLVAITAESVRSSDPPQQWPAVPDRVLRTMEPAIAFFQAGGTTVPAGLVLRGLMAWTFLLGTVSLELFGQFHSVITTERAARSPFFDAEWSGS